MIKFKIIRWTLILFILIKVLVVGLYVYLIRKILYDISIPYSPVLPHFVSIGQIILSAVGLYYIQRSCRKFIDHGSFNKESATDLRTGGYISGLTAFAALFWAILWRQTSKTDGFADLMNFALYLTSTSHQITVLIISLALLAVADLIMNGARIKRENDLTI